MYTVLYASSLKEFCFEVQCEHLIFICYYKSLFELTNLKI